MREIYDSGKNIGMRELTPYKGILIEKSWKEDENGNRYEIMYIGHTQEDEFIACGETLLNLKKEIDKKYGEIH